VLNDTTALFSGNPLKGLVDGGAIFMQSPYTDPRTCGSGSRAPQEDDPREEAARVLLPTWCKIAREVASGRPADADAGHRAAGRVPEADALRQGSGMTDEQVYAGVEKALRKYFGKRGEQVVQDNLTCVKRGYSEMQERRSRPDRNNKSATARQSPASNRFRVQGSACR
jgi:pyruvate-ferredoxin/flavodoxin oxidoreductase